MEVSFLCVWTNSPVSIYSVNSMCVARVDFFLVDKLNLRHILIQQITVQITAIKGQGQNDRYLQLTSPVPQTSIL